MKYYSRGLPSQNIAATCRIALSVLIFFTAATASLGQTVAISRIVDIDPPVYGGLGARAASGRVASNGHGSLLVWLDSRNGPAQVYCSPLSVLAEPLLPGGIQVAKLSAASQNLCVASNGKDYLLVWESLNVVEGLYVLRVGGDGTLLDPSPVRIASILSSDTFMPSVASDGVDYLIAWRFRASNGKHDIFARRFSADGVLLDSAPIVVAGGDAEQDSPAVAGVAGEYLVAWSENPGASPSTAILAAARLDSSGVRLDATNFPVTSLTGPHNNPVATGNGSGFLVAWELSDTNGVPDAVAARVGLAGPVLDPTPLFLTSDPDGESMLSAATDGADFVVLWRQLPPNSPTGNSDIHGARVSGSGGQITPFSPNLLQQTASPESAPCVVFDGQVYSTVWTSSSGSFSGINGFRLTPDAKPADIKPHLLTGRSNRQFLPAYVGTTGGSLAAWFDSRAGDGATNALFISSFNQAGQPNRPPLLVTNLAHPPIFLTLASAGDKALAVWVEKNQYDGQVRTLSLWLTSEGQPISQPQIVFPTGGSPNLRIAAGDNGWLLVDQVSVAAPGNPHWTQIRAFPLAFDGSLSNTNGMLVSSSRQLDQSAGPAVAFNGTSYLVAWSDGSVDFGIYAARLTTQGQLIDTNGGAPISVVSGQLKGSPAIASDGDGYYIAWEQRAVSTSNNNTRGTLVSANLQVTSTNGVALGAGSNQSNPSVAFDGSRYLVAWQQDRTTALSLTRYVAGILVELDGSTGAKLALPEESSDELGPVVVSEAGGFSIGYLWRDLEAQSGDLRFRRFLAPDDSIFISADRTASPAAMGGIPALIAPNATLADPAPADYYGGGITATLGTNAPPGTRLAVIPDFASGQFLVVGTNVIIGPAPVPIAEYETDSSSIRIHFIAIVDPQEALHVLKRIAITVPPGVVGADAPWVDVSLVLTNGAGITSPAAQVSVPLVSYPGLTNQYAQYSITAGQDLTIPLGLTGGGLKLMWIFNGVALGGADSSPLVIPAALESRAGDYSVLVTNASGSVGRMVATFSILPDTPSVVVDQQAQTVSAGETTFFRVAAQANLPLSYQWMHDGTNLPGATGPFLRLPAVSATNAGDYSVLVSNDSTFIVSPPAALAVMPLEGLPQPLWAATWGGSNQVVFAFDRALSGVTPANIQLYSTNGAVGIRKALLDLADRRRIIAITTNALNPTDAYFIAATYIYDFLGNLLTNSTPVAVDQRLVNQSLLGESRAGFQDDFDGPYRDLRWKPVGAGGDFYVQYDGVLSMTANDGDPNHLLFAEPGYDPIAQDVLARVRVVTMDVGDGPRAGVAAVVDPGSNHGINLLARREAGTTNSVKLLNDLVAWGPATVLSWQSNQWFWMRLHHDSDVSTHGDYVVAKVWPADGATPEPALWTSWEYGESFSIPPIPVNSGLAGLTANSNRGLSQMDVDYIFISALGLPPAVVQPKAFMSRIDSVELASDGSIKLQVEGLPGAVARVQSSADLRSWADLSLVSLGSGPTEVDDLETPASEARFYRVVIQ